VQTVLGGKKALKEKKGDGNNKDTDKFEDVKDQLVGECLP
jgi:hypothetical protein